MAYFLTGGTGFLGRNLIHRLLKRDGTIYVLCRNKNAQQRLATWQQENGVEEGRIQAVFGDLTQEKLGIAEQDIANLKGKIDHFFHLAAIYDLSAGAEEQQAVNVMGTQNAMDAAELLTAGCFHHISSIAAAGLYDGHFREDMFDEAENLDHPYFSTKHQAERTVRENCKIPFRVYRPGMVVGDSKTGVADRVDGPYYFFKMIQRIRGVLPAWMPTIGLEGGRLNIVPVDYVVDAVDHIAHKSELDGNCFHITDPKPYRSGEVLNIFSEAGHAPRMALRFDARLFGLVPNQVKQAIMALPTIKQIADVTMKDLGIPPAVLQFFTYPTEFDCRETQKALKGSGIECPRLPHYAPAIWDYWERHLDPEISGDRSLQGRVAGKIILITGASSGIGQATAFKLAEKGAEMILVARDEEKLAETRAQVEELGGIAHTYQCDLSNTADVERLTADILEIHGRVDILINNAGRSIRRSIANSIDRFHDFERTMQLNYFGALKLTLGLLPSMEAQGGGHVINISSIGVLTNAPRFSAYVASKAALDAFTRCAAAEYSDLNVNFTTINMPLVATPMIAPTKIYQSVPTLKPEEAADLVATAIIDKPKRIATNLGIFGQVIHALFPKLAEIIMNSSFRMFPDSKDSDQGKEKSTEKASSAEMIAVSALLRGIYL
ncbi:short chain dehydrogenase [Photobacterium jeanii]|uniref:Short chain dehydrogenase n=1 Tax=Photobacterium jeanii TaxID=858640 RepID=A0A178KLE0_9GAMM|nr:SDR family oxidoreductase [Photobacterium jeanii]OAN18149.1 short chain dehydrogenase [Photobacterium jeanii]PST92175.1 short chain dehydrogenase [Photobacterium jeanii]